MRPVLVVDEAQHVRSDVIEDLRLLTNYDMDSQSRRCLVLVGQVELRRRLAMALHEPLSQRIVVRHHLTGLTRTKLPLYLGHLFLSPVRSSRSSMSRPSRRSSTP